MTGLARGGLAELAVAVVAAAVLGLPLGYVAQRTSAPPLLRQYVDVLGMSVAVVLIGAVVASADLPPLYSATLAAVLWWVPTVLGRRFAWLGAVVLAVVAVSGVFGFGHWTYVEPQWGGVASWWHRSVVVGLLLTGFGGTAWLGASPRRQPPLALGAGVLAALGMTLLLALTWDVPGVLPQVAALCLGVGVALGVSTDSPSRPIALLGGLLAALFACSPPEASVVGMTTGLPLAVSGFALALAWQARGATRWVCGVIALCVGAVGVVAWSGVPDSVVGAVALALVPLVFVWVLGPTVLDRAETT